MLRQVKGRERVRYLLEEGIKAVDLLLLFDESVILSHTFQGERVHQIDLIRVLQVAVGEGFDRYRESGREKEDLALSGAKGEESFDRLLRTVRV